MEEYINRAVFDSVLVKTLHDNLTSAGRSCKEACHIIVMLSDCYEAHKDLPPKELVSMVWKDFLNCE